MAEPRSERTVALALSGGGARGLAHIGVLRALEERSIGIEAIAGCSMGAIVGAMYGSGRSTDEIVEFFAETRFHDVLDFGAHAGLIKGLGLAERLSEQVCDQFDDLQIPLKVTSVDVQRGTLVVIGNGELLPALRATSALPGIVSPVEHLGRHLIDGGVLNNLPIDVVRTMSLQPVVAVDCGAPHDRPLDFDSDHGFLDAIQRLRDRKLRTLTMEMFLKSFDIPQRFITQTRLAMDPPESLVRPKLPVDFGIEDVHRIHEAVDLGYEAAVEALDTEVDDDGRLSFRGR